MTLAIVSLAVFRAVIDCPLCIDSSIIDHVNIDDKAMYRKEIQRRQGNLE